MGVSILELGGAGDIRYVLNLFGQDGFQVPLSFLIDEDAASDTATKMGVAATDLGTKSVHICSKDLEDEYVRAIGHDTLWEGIKASNLFSNNELANCSASGTEWRLHARRHRYVLPAKQGRL